MGDSHQTGSADPGPFSQVALLKNLFATRELSDSVRRRLELAVAVAQERLLNAHVHHALAMVHVVDGRMSYGQAVSVYTRVLGLTDDDARVVSTRALANLGEKAAAEDWPEPAPEPEPEPEERGERWRSLLDVVKTRLRGRVNDEMRRRVEFAAARAEVDLLDAHVENALEFIGLLEREMAATEAVELYLDALDVRDGIGEVVYYKGIAHLADRHLPAPPAKAATPPLTSDEPRLRVVERDGG